MELITSEEIGQLIECYKLGCFITKKQYWDNDMLDLINSVKKVRSLNLLLDTILTGQLPITLQNGTLTIVCDKAESLEQIKSGGFINET